VATGEGEDCREVCLVDGVDLAEERFAAGGCVDGEQVAGVGGGATGVQGAGGDVDDGALGGGMPGGGVGEDELEGSVEDVEQFVFVFVFVAVRWGSGVEGTAWRMAASCPLVSELESLMVAVVPRTLWESPEAG
jgi:hypothetical protein